VKVIDLHRKRFGYLIACYRQGSLNGKAAWLCLCNCGARVLARSGDLISGKMKSCGCQQGNHGPLSLKTRNKISKTRTVHGHGGSRLNETTSSPTYSSWRGMIDRCFNKNHKAYHRYGGSGITVCERWRTFEHFLTDMGPKPKGKSLGRILDMTNYEPGACFWMSREEQGLCRRNHYSLLKWFQNTWRKT